MGMTKVRDGAKIEKGAGSSMREALPGDPICKTGWFVGEITMKDFLSKTWKNISEADGNKEDPEDKLGQ